MQLTVHSVGHGQCITLFHPAGFALMWDCGYDYYFRPSSFLASRNINRLDYFFVTNFDEDHIGDLQALRRDVELSVLYRNGSFSASDLKRLKLESGPISPAMASMLDMMGSYTSSSSGQDPTIPGVSFNVYWNDLSEEICDTNNLSLVTFLNCNGTKILIPGDLERKGWMSLLRNPRFRWELNDTSIFVTSHHGRESGYCAEVFEFCSPDVFVSSDSSVQYASQEMAQRYGRHARGISFHGELRQFLSTRKDGHICWEF